MQYLCRKGMKDFLHVKSVFGFIDLDWDRSVRSFFGLYGFLIVNFHVRSAFEVVDLDWGKRVRGGFFGLFEFLVVNVKSQFKMRKMQEAESLRALSFSSGSPFTEVDDDWVVMINFGKIIFFSEF